MVILLVVVLGDDELHVSHEWVVLDSVFRIARFFFAEILVEILGLLLAW
jgi:hypothetical protein